MKGKLILNDDKSWSLEEWDGTVWNVLPASLLVRRCVPGEWVDFVHYEVWEYAECDTQTKRYAKILPEKQEPPYVSDNFQIGPDGAYEHIEEDLSWEDIEKEYSNDQYPPFGGPFTDALSPWEWLKKHFETPNRKI